MPTIIDRDNQEPDVLYVLPDGTCFVTPDGMGRYWYDDEEQAESEDEGYAFIERTEHIDGVVND